MKQQRDLVVKLQDSQIDIYFFFFLFSTLEMYAHHFSFSRLLSEKNLNKKLKIKNNIKTEKETTRERNFRLIFFVFCIKNKIKRIGKQQLIVESQRKKNFFLKFY